MIIAITGKIGTGKTSLAQKIHKDRFFLASDGTRVLFKNADICEADEIGHVLLIDQKVKEIVIECFGTEILEGESISRRKLGNIVFSDQKEMEKLTAILHPRITEVCCKKIEEAKQTGENMIIAAALPKSLNILSLCDHVIQLNVDKEVVWQRIQERNPDMTRERFDTIWLWQDTEYDNA